MRGSEMLYLVRATGANVCSIFPSEAVRIMSYMDRAALEQMLGRGLSLAQIARRVGRHESTVAYWVRKQGLSAVNVRNHAAKGGLAKAELERSIGDGKTIAQIARDLDRSKATVRYWLERHRIQRAGRPGMRPREDAETARAAGLARAPLRCPTHGVVEHVREKRGYFRCGRCRQEAVIRRRRRVKEILVGEFGGCCQVCGYSRCLAALEFHHVDPSTKAFGLARHGAHGIDRLRSEARKCVLLCSNCHAEIESGAISGVVQLGRSGVAQLAERSPVKA